MWTRMTSPIPSPPYSVVHAGLDPPGKHQAEGDVS